MLERFEPEAYPRLKLELPPQELLFYLAFPDGDYAAGRFLSYFWETEFAEQDWFAL